ncbi:MAG: glycosyltransferase [Gammaproteobacteria bacterium]|nr:glycosyltransferase [Gammaproteobacteria bacterium]MCW8840445.1 glycosyltransferase [Gammaproteobacteria bacterium]MCW8959141.1 glycosyltransferase [Gammaproteobacteria bacterium]MCW8993304.1 glycosyltransferase [Gammaproteobacteria bacterium]
MSNRLSEDAVQDTDSLGAPVLSIITITLNDKEGLAETINSVLQQIGGLSIEHIIVDGCSNYDVSGLLRASGSAASLISEKDDGLYDAMNKGMRIANGRYLIFLNSGDVFADNSVLKKISKVIEDQDADLIYGDSLERQLDGSVVYKKSRNIKTMPLGMITHHQSMIFKREVIQNNNIKYNTDLRLASDYEFCIEFFKAAKRVAYLPRAISTFQRGGVSYQQRSKARYEQYLIRKNQYGSRLFAGAVMAAQWMLRTLRQFSPKLYWLVKSRF